MADPPPEVPGPPVPVGIGRDEDQGLYLDEQPPLSIHGVFISDEVSLEGSFPAVQAKLATLIRGGLLSRASARAYSSEITGRARVGPLGPVPGLSKVVQVRVQNLKTTGDSARFALRWEATGPGAAVFPVLDADITLAPGGVHSTTLTLTGAYRPPLGTAGAALDRAVMRRTAHATIRAFLHHIAEAIANPARAEPDTGAAALDPPLRPGEPDTP